MEYLQKRSLTGFAVKIIAIVTMFIDHCGAVFVERKIWQIQWTNPAWQDDSLYKTLNIVDDVMRSIGRLAFPLFIFLLVQGFMHTRSRLKYAVRLGLFALISEVPFDMAFMNKTFTMSYQNVFFTLLLGFLFMCTADFIYQKHIAPWLGYVGIILSSGLIGYLGATWFKEMAPDFDIAPFKGMGFLVSVAVFAAISVIAEILICRKKTFEEFTKFSLSILALALFMLAASSLHTDYNAGGVLAIAVAYAFRNDKLKSILGAVIVLTLFCSVIEAVALFDCIIIARYNGEKGRSMKYFFYAFYPCHLLLIALIAKFLLGL